VVLAQARQVRVELLDPLLVRLEQLGADAARFCEFLELVVWGGVG